MRKITLGEFERKCNSELNNNCKGLFMTEEQEWFDPIQVPVVKYPFDAINVMFGPNRIALCNNRSYIDLLFIKEILCEDNDSGCDYIVICGDEAFKKTYKFSVK